METKTMTSTEKVSPRKRKSYVTLPDKVAELTRCADEHNYQAIYDEVKRRNLTDSRVKDFADLSRQFLILRGDFDLINATRKALKDGCRDKNDMEDIFDKIRCQLPVSPISQYKFLTWVQDFAFNYIRLRSEGKVGYRPR